MVIALKFYVIQRLKMTFLNRYTSYKLLLCDVPFSVPLHVESFNFEFLKKGLFL